MFDGIPKKWVEGRDRLGRKIGFWVKDDRAITLPPETFKYEYRMDGGAPQKDTSDNLQELVAGLAANSLHGFEVRAKSLDGQIGPWAPVPPKTTYTMLPTPTGLTVSVISASRLDVSWTATPGANSYTLQRSTAPDFSSGLTTFNLGNVLVLSDTGLVANTLYYYRLKA